MSLLAAFLAIAQEWRSVFPQQRTFRRGVRQALGPLAGLGRRCLTRVIWTNGGQNRSWSAEYFLYSRCQWEPQQLFQPILRRALAYCPATFGRRGHRRYLRAANAVSISEPRARRGSASTGPIWWSISIRRSDRPVELCALLAPLWGDCRTQRHPSAPGPSVAKIYFPNELLHMDANPCILKVSPQ